MKRLLFAVLSLASLALQAAEPVRRDLAIAADDGTALHLRHVQIGDAGRPILLLHGARVAGVASFDLPVSGGSLAADLAGRGFDVYILDVRDYGGSGLPPGMAASPDGQPALVRSSAAVHDIDAAVAFIRRQRKGEPVALFGWATGGQWAGHYASLHGGKLSALIMLNSLYRGNGAHPLIGRGSALDDPARPGSFRRAACGAYRYNDAASILRPWDTSIPGEDKSAWRDPAVAQAYARAALVADASSAQRSPPSARSPCGALEDSFYLASGRQLWDASLVTTPTLALRGERDFWSRPEDLDHLAKDLVHAPAVRTLTLPDTSHFVHLEHAGRGRDQLLREIDAFVPAVPAQLVKRPSK